MSGWMVSFLNYRSNKMRYKENEWDFIFWLAWFIGVLTGVTVGFIIWGLI